MKKSILLLLIMSFLTGCSTSSDNDSEDQIKGEWIWIESTGGIGGTTETPESTQKEISLVISDISIKQFENGTLELDRTYTIERRESVIYGEPREMIIYDNGAKHIYTITGNQLFLTGDCEDCFRAEYQRK